MSNFGKYTQKNIEKMIMNLDEANEKNGIKKMEYDFIQTTEAHVKITENQIVITGKTLINGIDYQPIKQVIRRKDDEIMFEAILLTYQLYGRFADGTVDELL